MTGPFADVELITVEVPAAVTTATVQVPGERGPAGQTGAPGSAGPQGIQGVKGDQGPAGAGVSDATTTSKGSVQLAGDLAGTAVAPKVVKAASFTFQDFDNNGNPEPTLYFNLPGTSGAIRIGNPNGALRILPYNNDYTYIQSTLPSLQFSGLNGGQGTALVFNYAQTYFYGGASSDNGPTTAGHLTRKDYVDATTKTSSQISDATTTGRALMTTASAAAARTTLGAGTSSLALGTTSTTAAAGNHTHANAKGYVNHGTTAGTARPAGYASIEWYGSVAPTNAAAGDTWVNTA